MPPEDTTRPTPVWRNGRWTLSSKDRKRSAARWEAAEAEEQAMAARAEAARARLRERSRQSYAERRARQAKSIAFGQRRRAHVLAVIINDFTTEQWSEVLAAWKYCCAYCGLLDGENLTQDHVVPISRGGNHTKCNIAPACPPCNSRKGNRPAPPFYTKNVPDYLR